MSLRNLIFAATTLAVASCATDTPEPVKQKKNGVGDAVHDFVKDAGKEVGLGPIESRVAAGAAQKFIEHPEEIQAAVDKAENYLQNNPDKREKWKNEARKILDGNPELEEAVSRLFK